MKRAASIHKGNQKRAAQAAVPAQNSIRGKKLVVYDPKFRPKHDRNLRSLLCRKNSLFGENNSLLRQKNSLFRCIGNLSASY
jgi:hypothetical protein